MTARRRATTQWVSGKKITPRHAPFLLVGIGDLGVAVYLITWGFLAIERSRAEVGLTIGSYAVGVGFLTILLGVVTLAFLPDLSSLSRKGYAFCVAAVVLLGAPCWITIFWSAQRAGSAALVSDNRTW